MLKPIENFAPQSSPFLSLCICTMNRPEELNSCLESVFEATEKPDELIVSDDSLDGTPSRIIANKYLLVFYQEGPRRGLGANRNACINRASGTHIIFLDDDVKVPPDFFRVARQLIRDCEPKTIITGHEMNHGGGGRWTGEIKKVTPSNADFWGVQRLPIENDYRAITINSTIFPANLFKQALFDNNLRYGSDEIDIARHAISLGYRIVYQDCLYVNHYPSLVNREANKRFVQSSRLYATAKAYWQYEKSLPKTLLYILLAPFQLIISTAKKGNLSSILEAGKSIILAISYFYKGRRKIKTN